MGGRNGDGKVGNRLSSKSRSMKWAQDLNEEGAVEGVMRVQPASIIEEPRSRRAAVARVSVTR